MLHIKFLEYFTRLQQRDLVE